MESNDRLLSKHTCKTRRLILSLNYYDPLKHNNILISISLHGVFVCMPENLLQLTWEAVSYFRLSHSGFSPPRPCFNFRAVHLWFLLKWHQNTIFYDYRDLLLSLVTSPMFHIHPPFIRFMVSGPVTGHNSSLAFPAFPSNSIFSLSRE
jgi:hypothetical protein